MKISTNGKIAIVLAVLFFWYMSRNTSWEEDLYDDDDDYDCDY